MSHEELPILDLSVPLHKKLLIERIKTLQGKYRIEITRCRDQRSLAQNSYLWGVVMPCVCRGLREAWGETVPADEAYDFLKDRFLRVPKINKETGEIVGHVARGSSKLDTAEFTEFLENVIKFAAQELGVEVPPARHYREEAVPA